jgi:hypothetical protein
MAEDVKKPSGVKNQKRMKKAPPPLLPEAVYTFSASMSIRSIPLPILMYTV